MKWSDEQLKVLNGSGNMLVSASAGSGKTTVMLERVMRLIKNGVDLRRILLMTFSRASAQEMNEKLVKKLYEEMGTDAKCAPMIKKQLDNLPFANISTIDGFCYSLMQKYFNIAECDPSAVIGDSEQLKVVLTECLDKVIEANLQAKSKAFIDTVKYFRQQRSYDAFKNTIIKIYNFADCRLDKEKFWSVCRENDVEKLTEYYLYHRKLILPYATEAAERAIAEAKDCGYDKYVDSYSLALRLLQAAQKSDNYDDFYNRIMQLPTLRKIGKNYVENGKVSFGLKDASDSLSDYLSDLKKTVEDEHYIYLDTSTATQQKYIKETLVRVCQELEKEYGAYKKRHNVVDFSDTTRYVLKILQNEKAREEIRNSFDYVFVDEYQDTNYLQERLLQGICKDDNLFSVGDVKQAIYHFRSAEPQIFLDRMANYAGQKTGDNYELNTNYRSTREILDFTNRVCNVIMKENFCGIDYKNTSQFSWGETVKNIDGQKAVRIFTYDKVKAEKQTAEGIYRVKTAEVGEAEDRTEAEFTARQILKTLREVTLCDNGVNRKAGFGDVAVLLRTKKPLGMVFDAFRKYGIPFYSVNEPFSIMPERETLVDCIRVVLNAEQDIPLYNVLSSPIFGFSVSELTSMRVQANDKSKNISLWATINTYSGTLSLEKKIKTTVAYLDELKLKSAYMTVSELMNEILKHNYDAYLLAEGDDTIEKINGFVEYVSSLSCNSSAEAFLTFYDTAYKGNAVPVKEDAVAVMTMHGSKGLEFPIVFLPYQGQTAGGNNSEQTAMDGDLGLAVKAYNDSDKSTKETFAMRVIRMKAADEDRKEAARLMYVAFTRAKNYLVISGVNVNKPSNVFEGASIMQWLTLAAESDNVVKNCFEEIKQEEKEPAKPIVFDEKKAEWSLLERKYQYAEETVRPLKYSVSEILQKEEDYGENPFVKGSCDDAITTGVAIHAVMQHIDFSLDTLTAVEEAVKEMKDAGYLTQMEFEKVPCEKIFNTLQSEVIEEAKKYECMREQPFVMYVYPDEKATDRVLVQGVIDLLIDYGDTFGIVDFKTGNATEKIMRKRYARQLELYAQGVEKIFKKAVSKKIIYSINSGCIINL